MSVTSLSAPISLDASHHALALHLADAAAATFDALAAVGVTHVVNVTPGLPTPQDAAEEPGLTTMRIPVDDDVNAPLHQHLDAAADFIAAALAAGGRVCVFCADGRSTAPAVVAFFLMRQHGCSLASALGAIGAVQPCARPNVGFWQRLIEAESWLRSGPPSMSVQQYRWAYLQQSHPGIARDEILERLQRGQSEILAVLHLHSYTPV